MTSLKSRRALLRENENREHYLYRLFDAQDNLLYVGVTFMPGNRFDQHRREKHWWDQVARKEIEPFESRSSALDAERSVIAAEAPRHNLALRVT